MSADLGPAPITPLPLDTPPEPMPERRQRRRDRTGASHQPRESVPARNRGAGRWVKGVVALVVVAVVTVPIMLWSRYSTAFVTSRNATVKGSITNVGGQTNGVVASVEVEAGDRVRAGQVLARFEDHQLQANLLRARSRLAEAMARASGARPRIDAAQSQSHEASVRYEQRVALAQSGAVSLDELRAAETRLQTTQAMERTALADQDAAVAEVSTAEADLAIARADLDASVIRAPADGRVLRRISEPGASVVVGQPIVALWIGRGVWVEAWIDQDDLAKVAVGNDVKVTTSSFPGRVFHGTVESIGVSTDFELPQNSVPQARNERMRTTPVVPLRVRLDQSRGLMPGLSVVVAIQRTGTK
jgi:membrane fusion protein, multidrug efflux system